MWSNIWSWLGKNAMPLINTVFNGISSWFGQKQTNANIDKLLEAQKEEQIANREYNYQLWQDENAYNSPAQQKARLEQAGLNADMMYGGSGVMNTASSPTPSLQMDWSSLANKRTASDVLSQTLDNQYKQAMIDNVNANTKKQGAETSILTDEAAFKTALLSGELKLQDATIKLTEKQGNLVDQNIKESQARCQQIEANVSEINANIQSIHNAIKNDNVRLELEKALNSGQLKQIAADCNLKYEEANKIRVSLDAYINNLNADTNVKLGQQASLEIANGRAAFEAKLNGKFGYDKELGIVDNYLKCVNRILTTYSSMLGPAINALK